MTRTSTILLEGLKDRDNQDIWREFDGRYRALLLAVARRLGLCPSDAEDAAQETLTAFVVEYRQGRYSRQNGRLRDWLAGIMSHKVRDIQRRHVRQSRAIEAAGLDHSMETVEDQSMAESMQREWSAAVLRECLENVRRETSARMFESFEMYALQQMPVNQVSQRLGMSVESIYQNKRRILQRIRELVPHMEELW